MSVSGWGQLLFVVAVTAVGAPLLGRYLAMLIGRFAPIVLALAIAGSLAGARVHARTRATLDTAGPTFAAFLLGVIVIVGGLIYFPMLILGPVGERITG
jgi:potassium-transporting ATPase potassium-binding subunit